MTENEKRDWAGRPTNNVGIFLAWEVTPHVQNPYYYSMRVQAWQEMLEIVRGNLDSFLEHYTEEELRDGVTLTFRLVETDATEMEELEND